MMTKIALKAADGARAELTTQGAHLCSWVPARGVEQLFMSSTSGEGEGIARRGGVPIIFPQFAGMGSLPKHGFARTAEWRLLRSGALEEGGAQAVFELQENIARLMIWPHVFRAELVVSLAGDSLRLDFSVVNNGDTSFQFTTALHTYFQIEDIAQTQVRGLGGLDYRDTVTAKNNCRQEQALLQIEGEIDRIYGKISAPILIEQAHQTMHISQTGFADAVVWNPGAVKGAQLVDMEIDGYRRMLCVEAAAVLQPIQLKPGGMWTGAQVLRCIPK